METKSYNFILKMVFYVYILNTTRFNNKVPIIMYQNYTYRGEFLLIKQNNSFLVGTMWLYTG